MSKAFDQGREQAAAWSRTGHPVSCYADPVNDFQRGWNAGLGLKSWTVIGFWWNDEPVSAGVVEGRHPVWIGAALAGDLDSSFQGGWTETVTAALASEAEAAAEARMRVTLCGDDVKDEPCAVCGDAPTQCTSAAGERLCGPHGAQDMAAGEDVAWDGDSEQRWQLAGEQVVNHDTVREQTGEDA